MRPGYKLKKAHVPVSLQVSSHIPQRLTVKARDDGDVYGFFVSQYKSKD
jgi:hypothetical protein